MICRYIRKQTYKIIKVIETTQDMRTLLRIRTIHAETQPPKKAANLTNTASSSFGLNGGQLKMLVCTQVPDTAVIIIITENDYLNQLLGSAALLINTHNDWTHIHRDLQGHIAKNIQ